MKLMGSMINAKLSAGQDVYSFSKGSKYLINWLVNQDGTGGLGSGNSVSLGADSVVFADKLFAQIFGSIKVIIYVV